MTDQSKRALVVGICDMRTPLTLKEIKTINELSIEVKRHNVMKHYIPCCIKCGL